jgi:rhomboid family GlyGly-CTERM serine protease
VDAATRLTPAGFPVWTLLICAAAGVIHGTPPLQALLIYERAAVDGGELWRLVTGNLVHHSTSHFVFNVVPLVIAGALIEMQRLRQFLLLCVVSGMLVGAAIHLGRLEIVVFGGLSGIVTAAVTILCLNGLNRTGAWRWLCVAVLACLVAKIGAELTLGWSLVFGGGQSDFVAVPESHVVGAATALLLFVWTALADYRHQPAEREVAQVVRAARDAGAVEDPLGKHCGQHAGAIPGVPEVGPRALVARHQGGRREGGMSIVA